METISVTFEVPKEGKEIVDALDALLEKILAKAPLTEYTTLLDEIYAAADGVSGVAEEVKSEFRDELAGYMTQRLMSRLLPAS